MASLRCMLLLVRKSVFKVQNLSVPRRTFASLNHRICRNSSCVSRGPLWLSVTKYSTEKVRPENSTPPPPAPPSVGLAEELLSAKVQAEKKATRSQENVDEEDSEKARQEKEKTWRAIKYTFIALGVSMTAMGGFLITTWGAPNVDPQGNEIPDEFSTLPLPQQYLYRTWQGMTDMNRMIQEPSRERLLPDPVKQPYIQPPYTLVMELRDVLVHPEWTYETGWRFKKRPGVDFLLQHCAPPLFEIVIYTNDQGFTALPIIDHLDSNGFIWYRLFKDSTRYVDGKHIKDLSSLNRDLKRVICVDWDPDAVSSHRNHLKLKRWDGNMRDNQLVELGFMLRTIAESEVDDVRDVIDYYRTFDDPLAAFRENQRQAQEQELVMKQRVEEERQHTFTSSWSSSFLRRR